MGMIRRRRSFGARWADPTENNYPVGTPAYEVPSLYPDGIVRWRVAGSLTANDKARGFGGQIGNLVDPITSAGYGVTLYAPWDGALNELILRADASCSAVVDVLLNGVSIFTGASVKPTLSASQTDDKTDMTDITVDFVKGDRFDLVLDSVSGDPTLLSLTLFSETT